MSVPPLPAPPRERPPATLRQDIALAVLTGATVLTLLHFGRPVLVPLTLALILSLAVAPLVKLLRRTGLGQTGAVLVAAAGLSTLLAALVLMIGLQVVQIAASLPQYESTIRLKLGALRELTVVRVEALEGAARQIADRLGDGASSEVEPQAEPEAEVPPSTGVVPARQGTSMRPLPVVVQPARSSAYQVIGQLAWSVWAPLQTAGIVLIVLLFVLLEHESLRDRFIRLAGGTDLRSATVAVNDAGERLSRFFVSQFAVNFGVGALIWAGLLAIGLPHAGLWAALTVVLRFVPYVGVVAAALAAGLLAAAVEPGWSMVLLTLGLFVLVEVVVAQGVEPQLYGHSTGLSPLSVVVSAIFWSWLWGPIGLIVATPLTLCLVVAGRHVEALGFLDVLLGDSQALTMPQRFYQRALSGDSDEIIAAARVFLKRRSFAAYCDLVLLRAMQLTRDDLAAGTITLDQQRMVRDAIVHVIEALGNAPSARRPRRDRGVVLEELNAGAQLRRYREEQSGRWQGPLSAPAGSIVLCIGLGSIGDDIATELLVRILRDLHIDARHLSIDEFVSSPPAGATPGSVAMTCIVSIASTDEEDKRRALTAAVKERLPSACIVATLLHGHLEPQEEAALFRGGDMFAGSFEEAAQQVISRLDRSAKSATPVEALTTS